MASTSSNLLVLYDIPSKGRCACWSPNVWKTRLVLNYKEIPYTTEWTEYPEIEPKLKGLGIPPNPPPDQWADYTCPALKFANGEYVMDSLKINEKLEALYPEPSLHLDLNVHQNIPPILGSALRAVSPMVMAGVLRNILREPSASFFAKDRHRRFGKTLEQLEKDEGGEAALEAAEKALEPLKLEIQRHKRDEGPFLLGSTVSYGDFMITIVFTWLERAAPVIYERFVGCDESFRTLYEACRPWLQRDGY